MPHPILFVLVFAFGAVVLTSGIWVPLLLWHRQRQAERRFAALAAGLGVPREGNCFHLEASGRSLRITLEVPTRGSPRILGIALPRPPGERSSGARVLLRVERGLDRFGKRVGLNREVQIGEPAFDRAVYIESDGPAEPVRALLGDEGRRRAVVDVLALGFTIEIHGPRALVAASRPRPGALHLTPEIVQRAAHGLAALAPWPATVTDGRAAARPTTLGVLGGVAAVVLGLPLLFGVVCALFVALGCRDAYPPVTSEIYLVAAAVGLGIFLLAMPLVGLVVRGRSDSLRIFGFVMAVLLYAVPAYTVAASLAINGGLDDAVSTRRTSRIVGRSSRSRKNGRSYHLQLAALHRGDDDLDLEVERSVYDRYEQGDAVTVTTGPGALGWEWVRRIDPVKKR